MAFREISVVAIREILRQWVAGVSLRTIAASTGTDRKTVRRYLQAAERHGLRRGSAGPVDDALVDAVVAEVLPGGSREAGDAREGCRTHLEQIRSWVTDGCKAPKIVRLLRDHCRVVVPVRTVQRFLREEVMPSKASTVRLVDPPKGQMLEIDFMALSRVMVGGDDVKLSALVCVASYSRHTFVWPCRTQTRQDVIDGLEAAWAFFGGVFPVVVLDNAKATVTRADPLSPRLDEAFLEYAQARDFLLDTTRVRRPRDKPKVERAVPYVRSDAFAGERFVDLDAVQRHAAAWCRDVAGARIHGTTRRKPIEMFEEERYLLKPAPESAYDPPVWSSHQVGPDGAVAVGGAVYSLPSAVRGLRVKVRADQKLVRVYARGRIVKVHARAVRGTVQVDPDDLPEAVRHLAARDPGSVAERAAEHGDGVGDYARRLLDNPLPWTRVRHVHRLLDLCRTFGAPAVNTACLHALALDVIDATRLQRLLERTPPAEATAAPPSPTKTGRFARPAADFRVTPEANHGAA